jgi:DNA-binding CsgD family transcriptional regulator
LAELDKIQGGREQLPRRECFDAVEESFNHTLMSLASRLGNSTVGVALFDKSLRCEALNAAFARITGSPLKYNSGKTVRQLFGADASKLDPVFERVWTTGTSLLNFDWTVQLPAAAKATRWHVNFHPIKNALGHIRHIAATFSEVTKRSRVELRLGRLADKFRADILDEPYPFGEEFAELSARTLDVVKRSVDLLKNSTSLRCYLSESRMETGLEGMHLFLEGTRTIEVMAYAELAAVESAPEVPVPPEDPPESEPAAGSPSPRERQILHLLADGKSNKEIALLLDISARTVECYRARIMIKLNLHTTAALVRYAIRHNIIDA